MVVHDSFGTPGRSRRVVDRADLVLVLQPGLDWLLGSGGEEVLELPPQFDPAEAGPRLGQLPFKLRREADEARSRMLQDVSDLLRREAGVDRHDDPSRLGNRKVAE